MPTLEELLKMTLKKEAVVNAPKKDEEEKEAETNATVAAPVDYDEVKVEKIMKIFVADKSKGGKSAPPKKDFRSFLK